jgi:hypothetical protein
MGVLPTFRESSPSSKLLQEQGPIIWWTNTCPWHGGNTTLQLHCSTMLGACLLQLHGAIYSRSQALGSWWSDNTITMWSWDLQTCAWLKTMTLFPNLTTSLSLVHQWCLSPSQSHMATVTLLDQWAVCRFPGGKRNLRPLLTRDLAVYATRQNLTLCQRAQRLT